MGLTVKEQVEKALEDRPHAKGNVIPLPKYPAYVYCPETDWLYSTKFNKHVDYYPLQRRTPDQWSDFDGFEFTDNYEKVKVSIKSLRSLVTKEEETMPSIQNSTTKNPADFKGKFIVGSISKKTGGMSFSLNPARHPTRESARTEAARLAQVDNSKMFVVCEVLDIASVQDVVFL